MAYQVQVDLGSGWEDISAYLSGRYPVQRSRSIHSADDPSKPVIGTARFSLVRNVTLINRFLTASTPPAVWIKKDGSDHFKGNIRNTHKVRVGLIRAEVFEVECVDAWMRLEKKCTLSTTWTNYTLSNPTTKSASILHQLFYAAGFSDGELSFSAVAITRDRAVFQASDGKTYREIVELILKEIGYSAIVSPSGIVSLYDMGPGSISTSATLTSGASGNIAGGYEIQRNEAKSEAVDVSFWSHVSKASAVVFEDSTGRDSTHLDCNIPVSAGGYYPTGADATHDVRGDFKLQDYEIIAVDSPAIDWSGTGISKQVETVDGLAMRMRFYSASGGTLTKLRVTGTATVKGDLSKVVQENVVGTEKREAIECAWIYAQANAERLAIVRANWHANSAYSWSIPECALLTISPGDYVQLTESNIMGASQVLRVVTVEDGGSPLSIKLVCEGASAYTYAALTRTTETSPPSSNPGYWGALGAASKTWIQAAAPTIGSRPNAIDGDTWIDSDGGNIVYLAQSGVWVQQDYSFPSDNGLIAHYSFDEISEYPDSAAGQHWKTEGGDVIPAAYNCTAASMVEAGTGLRFLRVTATGTDPYVQFTVPTSYHGKVVHFRVRKVSGDFSAPDGAFGYMADVGFSHAKQIETLFPGCNARLTAANYGEWVYYSILAPSDYSDYTIFRFDLSNASSIVYDVAFVYMGTGAYDTPALDNSGNENHGTINARAFPVEGVSGQGITTLTQKPFHVSVTRLLDECTISLWRKWDGSYGTNNSRVFASNRASAADAGFRWLYGWANDLYFSGPGEAWNAHAATVAEVSSTWQHWVIVFRKSGTCRVLCNLVDAITPWTAGSTQLSLGAGPLALGWAYDLTADICHAAFDELRIYSRALSDVEIRGLYALKSQGSNYSLSDFVTLRAADDGYITPAEKPAIRAEWVQVNGNGSTTGTYWANKAEATALSVATTGIDSAYTALSTMLWGTGGCVVLATWGDSIPVTAATYRDTWRSYYEEETKLKNAIAAKRAVDVSANFPPTTNLVSHYSFDGVPAIPDRTAGATYYRRNNFTSSEIVSSGANGIGTFSYFESAGWHPERVTVSSGALKISAQASANILRYGWNKSAAWVGIRVKTCVDVTLFLNNDGNDQNVSCKANTWRSYLGYFANSGQNFIDIECFPIGDNYIDMYYIGDGTYNPILDNAAGQFNSISMAGVFPYIGISGNALYFDGTNSYPVGLGPYHNTDGGSHTLSAWFKWNDQSSATYQTLSGILGRAGWHHGLMLDRATKKAVFLFLNTVPAETKPATTTSVNDGNWHHLCGVVDNTAKTVTLYLDGVQEAQSSYTGNPYQDTVQGWSIGGFGNPGVNYAYLFGGYIDECRIYNIALSSVQVRALYKQITMGNAFSQADYYNNLLPGSALRPVAWKPTWLTDMIIPSTVDGVLAKLVDVPSSAGMWYGETYMGYRDAGGVWRTYIDNSGYFKFGNADSSRYLKWDGSTFEISGKINLVDAAGATPASAGLYVASDKLGFYQTTGTPGWRAYLDNTGKFYAGDGGSTMGTNKFISWDLSDLKVSGNFKLGASCFLENGDGLIRLTYDNPASVWGGEGLVFVSNNRAFVAATAQIGDNRWSIQKVGSGQYADYLELCTVAGAFNNTYVVGIDRTISSSSASLQDTVFCSSSYGLRYLRTASSTAAAHRWDVTFTTEKSIAFAKDGTGTFLYPLSSAIDLGKSAARWNTAYTTYCDVLSYINLGGFYLYPGSPGAGAAGLGLTWNYSGSLGEVDLVCAQQGGVGGFNFYKNGNAGTMGLLAYIDSAGNICSQNYFRMTGGYVANPTVDGALWIDSTQKALSTYLNSRTHYDVGCLYSQYTTVTVANSNSQTTLIGGSSIGTNTIGSYNSNGALGKSFRLTAAGTCVLGDTTSTTFGFEIKLGTVSLGTVTSPALTTAATYHWSIEAVFLWSSSTQVRCIYKVTFGNAGAVTSSWAIETNATTVAATSYAIVPYVTQNRNHANVTTNCYFALLEELA